MLPLPGAERRQGALLLAGSWDAASCAKSGGLDQSCLRGITAVFKPLEPRRCAMVRASRSSQRAPALAQNGHRFSGRGAGIGGTKGSKMVPWVLLFFFGQLIRVFQLQHHGTLLSGHASQRQLCSRWASMSSYDGQTAAEPCHMLCGMAGGCYCVGQHLPRVRRRVERCALAVARFPDPHVCTCAHCLRVCRARATVGRPSKS